MIVINEDLRDLLLALEKFVVDYMIVGGYAVIAHGYARTTGDLDVWVKPTIENHRLLVRALDDFAQLSGMAPLEEFLNPEKADVFGIGRKPVRIEILTLVKGLNYDEASANAVRYEYSGVMARVLDLHDLIRSKKAAGRYRDLDDVEHLENPDIEY